MTCFTIKKNIKNQNKKYKQGFVLKNLLFKRKPLLILYLREEHFLEFGNKFFQYIVSYMGHITSSIVSFYRKFTPPLSRLICITSVDYSSETIQKLQKKKKKQ